MSGRTRTRRTAVAVLVALAALVVGALVAPAAARADDTCSITWKSGTGAWNDPTRWSPARVPTSDDDVCVIRATGADPISVKLPASVDAFHLTLRGATLSVAPTAFLDVAYIDASAATFTGGGEIRGGSGIITLTDSQLRGVHLSTGGGLRLGGRLTFTGGSTVTAFGFTDPSPGLRVVDGDGNGGNHIQLSRFPLYLRGSVFFGVGVQLVDMSVFSQGDLVFTHLDNLADDGALTATFRGALQLATSIDSSITLQRSITSIGNRVQVSAGDLRTPSGGDALQSSTLAVDGSLYLYRPFVAGGAIAVRGRLSSGYEVDAPSIAVRAGGSLTAARVTGSVSCAGSCDLRGAHLGRLALLPGATLGADLRQPITVDTSAALAGTLAVSVPGGQQPGRTYVLLTAAKGVTGTFDRVTTDRGDRPVRPAYQPTYVTGTVGGGA